MQGVPFPTTFQPFGGGILLDDDDAIAAEIRRRIKYTPDQVSLLEAVFASDPNPPTHKRDQIARQIGRTPRSVQIWFQNKRAKERSRLQAQAHMQAQRLGTAESSATTPTSSSSPSPPRISNEEFLRNYLQSLGPRPIVSQQPLQQSERRCPAHSVSPVLPQPTNRPPTTSTFPTPFYGYQNFPQAAAAAAAAAAAFHPSQFFQFGMPMYGFPTPFRGGASHQYQLPQPAAVAVPVPVPVPIPVPTITTTTCTDSNPSSTSGHRPSISPNRSPVAALMALSSVQPEPQSPNEDDAPDPNAVKTESDSPPSLDVPSVVTTQGALALAGDPIRISQPHFARLNETTQPQVFSFPPTSATDFSNPIPQFPSMPVLPPSDLTGDRDIFHAGISSPHFSGFGLILDPSELRRGSIDSQASTNSSPQRVHPINRARKRLISELLNYDNVFVEASFPPTPTSSSASTAAVSTRPIAELKQNAV